MNRPDLRFPALMLFGIYALYGFFFVPVNLWMGSDAVLVNSLWWDVVDFLMNLFEILGICAAFGFLIRGIYRCGARQCSSLLWLVGGALTFKYLASLISVFIIGGSIDLTMEFGSFFFPLAVELAELTVLVFFTERAFSRQKEALRLRRKAKKQLDGAAPDTTDPLPPKSFFDRTNPALLAAMIAVGILTVLRLITEIVADVAYALFGAAYTLSDIPVTLFYWVLMVFLPCFIGYLFLVSCMKLPERADAKQ